jgi:hypothetical protein
MTLLLQAGHTWRQNCGGVAHLLEKTGTPMLVLLLRALRVSSTGSTACGAPTKKSPGKTLKIKELGGRR